MAGTFFIKDANFTNPDKVAREIIAAARKLANDRQVAFPKNCSFGGAYGYSIDIKYTTNAHRDCLKETIESLGYEIIGQDHAGERSGPFFSNQFPGRP